MVSSRFDAPISNGTLADLTVEGRTLRAAFEQFKASPRPPGWCAVWYGLRLAGSVLVDGDGTESVDLKTETPRQANPFACGD
jgi:hypothetical protein